MEAGVGLDEIPLFGAGHALCEFQQFLVLFFGFVLNSLHNRAPTGFGQFLFKKELTEFSQCSRKMEIF